MAPPLIEACILAGGQSTRMGRDKRFVRLGGRTLLSHVRALARTSGFPVRVVRRDIVARCGPVGGVCTALETTGADRVLFLSCDMPLITPRTLQDLVRQSGTDQQAVFSDDGGIAGFPFLIPRDTVSQVRRQLKTRDRSLQRLAQTLDSRRFRIPSSRRWELLNINTPTDLASARQLWRMRFSRRHPAHKAQPRGKTKSLPAGCLAPPSALMSGTANSLLLRRASTRRRADPPGTESRIPA